MANQVYQLGRYFDQNLINVLSDDGQELDGVVLNFAGWSCGLIDERLSLMVHDRRFPSTLPFFTDWSAPRDVAIVEVLLEQFPGLRHPAIF